MGDNLALSVYGPALSASSKHPTLVVGFLKYPERRMISQRPEEFNLDLYFIMGM